MNLLKNIRSNYLSKDDIYDHRADLAGISLIAATGDKDYNQAPFTAVYSIEEQIKNWGFEATSSAYEIYPKFSEYNFNSLWDACSCVLGYFEPKISTYHSFCLDVLKEDGQEMGLNTNFKLITDAEQWMMLRKEIYKINLKVYLCSRKPS